MGGGPRNYILADYALHFSLVGERQSDSFDGRYAGGGAGKAELNFFAQILTLFI
jgi:hypothetical protein